MRHHPTPTLNPSPQGGGKFALLSFLVVALVSLPNDARSESPWFTVEIKSIEAMLVDRATGQLSENIVGADRKVFASSGGMNQTQTKPADDVFLRVGFKAMGDGNAQPPITVLVLAHEQYVEGLGIRVVHWQNVPERPVMFDAQGRGTVTALLKDVTCSQLDVVVRVGTDYTSGQGETVLLPFECKE